MTAGGKGDNDNYKPCTSKDFIEFCKKFNPNVERELTARRAAKKQPDMQRARTNAAVRAKLSVVPKAKPDA